VIYRIPLRIVIFCIAILSLGLAGCVLPDHIGKLQEDIADVQTRIRSLEQDQQQALLRMESMVQEMGNSEDIVTRTDFADLKLEIQDNTRKLAILDEQFRETNSRLDGQSRDIQEALVLLRGASRRQPGPAAIPGEETAGADTPVETPLVEDNPFRPGQDAVPDAQGLYNAAYADFSKGNYTLAVSGFDEYVDRFGASDLADNAMYWIGECQYSQGRFDKAVEAFDDLLEKYPDSDRAASANLKKGLAYLEMNDIRKAVVQLQFVLEKYSGSDDARIARDTLASLGVPAR
jgi:tol-pal system protein YbgF